MVDCYLLVLIDGLYVQSRIELTYKRLACRLQSKNMEAK